MKETLGSENSAPGRPARSRIDLLDWFKGCAILAVVFDHLKIVPGLYVTWAVNVFVLISGGHLVCSPLSSIFSLLFFLKKRFRLFLKQEQPGSVITGMHCPAK